MHHLQIVLLGKIHIIAGLNVNEFQLVLNKAICKFKCLRLSSSFHLNLYMPKLFPSLSMPRFTHNSLSSQPIKLLLHSVNLTL